jgi:nitroreductase
MTVRELVLRNRSYRRFEEHVEIGEAQLREWVDLARLAASGGNKQPLRYRLCCDPRTNAKVFESLGWAAYLQDWSGPVEGERPSAYIVILGDTAVASSFGCDHGIAAQSILLGAVEQGLGGCILGSVKHDSLRATLGIAPQYEILLVVALGKPSETVVVESVVGGDIRYWRDAQGRHHVPKRSLSEVILPACPQTVSPGS